MRLYCLGNKTTATMITYQNVQDVILKGLAKMAALYQVATPLVKIGFSLDEGGCVRYITYIGEQPKNTVSLSQLIGKNMYNFMVASHIKGLLQRFSVQHGCEQQDINILAATAADGTVELVLRRQYEKLRVITDPSELT
jgi:hypothetical protein